MSSKPAHAIRIKELEKRYYVYEKPRDRLLQLFLGNRKRLYRSFRALKPLSLDIKRGETLGIIGRNGSGKSTLLQLICGTLSPSAGDIEVNGRISALLELGAGFNPEFTGRENIYLNASILGLSKEEIDEKYETIVDFSGIRDHIMQPVKTYSSGMYVRLGFAIAVATDPDILVVDEALSVGDIAFQRKCFARIRDMQAKGATILFVSHSANTILEICDRAILLDQGDLLLSGDPGQVLSHYNRLAFAPKNKLAALRKEIAKIRTVNGTEKNGGEENVKRVKDEIFDPHMLPESTVYYESRGAVISSPTITTMKGKRVNYLKKGGKYRYQYQVHFKKAAKNVRFGMIMKTNTGIELGGATSHIEKNTIKNVKKGTIIEASFTFTCLLLPGTYFTNAGCTGTLNDERVALHRVLDACMFKVLPAKDSRVTGIVDFQISSRIREL